MFPKRFVILLFVAGMLLRAIISLHSYSGQNTPPMYGDFEAQRHWQEITINLPASEWYTNTTDNDLMYWGLDYPPLTAYHSWSLGWLAHRTNSSFVRLHTSRGLSTVQHKHFMRQTVLFADLVLYLPAILYVCTTLYKDHRQKQSLYLHAIIGVLYPGQILIDNGHFQYNNISLGLAALAIIGILGNRTWIGAVCFVLALNYKQMELYHALPVFFYLLANCFRQTDGKQIHVQRALKEVTALGVIVVALFAALWSPWLGSIRDLQQVIHRIFPLARGVFEDKVSNVWCILNVPLDIKERFSNQYMAGICFAVTMAAALPSCLHLMAKRKTETFLLSLINCSLAFFLFSFQVHEKSILLVTLPVLLYFPFDPLACLWFLQAATFSMVPLLARDGLLIAYIALNLLYLLVIKMAASEGRSSSYAWDVLNLNGIFAQRRPHYGLKWKISVRAIALVGCYLSVVASAVLLVCSVFVAPPSHLPHLYPLLISAYSCGQFSLFFLYFNYKQFTHK